LRKGKDQKRPGAAAGQRGRNETGDSPQNREERLRRTKRAWLPNPRKTVPGGKPFPRLNSLIPLVQARIPAFAGVYPQKTAVSEKKAQAFLVSPWRSDPLYLRLLLLSAQFRL